MNGIPPHSKWPAGRGRGHSTYPNLDFWEDRLGRNPGISHVRCDPVSGNFKLHVRSIPPTWNPTVLKNVFSKCGEPMNIYINPYRNNPSGLTWGFVEFATYQEACNAVQQLNNNVLLEIQVMFAREKPTDEEIDPVLQLLSSETEEYEPIHRSVESLNDTTPVIKRTVKNNNTISTDIPTENFHKPVLDSEALRRVEEALFQKILDIYKEGECPTAKCTLCEANCSMACSGCISVFYCSENCQNRDWPSHSRNCKGASTATVGDTTAYQRGGGDQKQTNGFGSFDSERENKSDNRSNRFGDRRNNRDSDRGFRDRSQNSNDKQDFSQGRKTLFEDRKSKISASRQKDDDRGFHNRFGQNNQRSQNDQGTRNAYKPTVRAEQADEDWGSTPQEIESNKKGPSTLADTAPVATDQSVRKAAEIQMPEAGKVLEVTDQSVRKAAEIQMPEAGKVLEVTIFYPETEDSYWVQIKTQSKEIMEHLSKLKEHFETCKSQFSPVKDGVCGIYYENAWFRCQVTNLDPLTVHYVDLGYPEEVTADRLFELSPELKALPHFAFKIKMAKGTSESFLGKNELECLVVKLIEKVDNCWLAQVVDDKIALPEVPKTETAHTSPVATTLKSTQDQQGAAENTPQAVVPSQQSSPKALVQQPFPPMFDPTNFTTLVITYHADSELGDTYYVGPTTIWDSVCEMCNHFKSVIDHCEVLTPKHGTKGLATYSNEWYRVKVVSLTPPLVHFVDFGNIDSLEAEGLRKCPETHKDVPHMVHKIKLAPGTSSKYFNLPGESQIRVKPVSWLPDSTVVVQVEGENYSETSEFSDGQEEKPSPLTPGFTSVPSTTTTTPVPDGPEEKPSPLTPGFTSVPSTSTTTPVPTSSPAPTPSPTPSSTTDKSESKASKDSVKVDIMPKRPPSTIDLLQEKWKISFVPNKVDLVKNSLLGQVYCENIPETFQFIADNEKYQNLLSTLEFDPNFRPSVGEVVALRSPSGEWERGRVLTQEGLVAFNDQCGVIRSSQLFKLPESFINIPSMAAVLTLSNEDSDLLNHLVDEVEIIFNVVKVISNPGSTVVHVTNNVLQKTTEGVLRRWEYEPLETPDPLASGDLVTISKVIDSNTLLVAPANDLEIQQIIQIDCRKTREEFKSTPKEGDYVAFLDKESDGYFRCRIDKVDKDEYEIYSVDNATYHKVKLGDLHPLPSSLCKIPCRITQIELKGVDKVDQTEHAQIYLSHIVEQDKCLKVHTDDSGKSTLTVEGEEDTLNNKLKELLKPKIVPDSDGKLTILSLSELAIPLNQEFNFFVSQTEPLYIQLSQHSLKYYKELHDTLQAHCANDNKPYNPCQGELCLALYDGEWYRCRCLKETNAGVSVLMLVDYGNMFNTQTSNIRQILPEMLTMPSIAISCKIHGLPDSVSPALKDRLDQLLAVNNEICGTFVAENEGCYEVVIDAVKQAIQELQ